MILRRVGNLAVWKLAVESTQLSSDKDSVDRFRAIFAIRSQTGYSTVQFIGSPYLLRAIRPNLPLDETIKGLRSGCQVLCVQRHRVPCGIDRVIPNGCHAHKVEAPYLPNIH